VGKSRIGPYGDAIMELDHRTGQVLDAIKTANVEGNTILPRCISRLVTSLSCVRLALW
jgi:hypothetical protein